ncbi:cytochrome c [Cohnella pontilimi]|uniref:Cytochrome c n=1 Tax=Cohnella pontilimi TaxID=2564100 RepID=A0A4U0FEP8_9BACL|nr:cytochrome c [Cohnella pontilimi]TJY42804.1 cytochrome c [Cohnella pontilimi]
MKKIGVLVLGFSLIFLAPACNRNNNGAPDQTPPAGTPAGTPTATTTASPGGSPAASPTASPTGGTADATALYQQQCLACHAADLSGGAGPALSNVGARLSADDIATRISNGGGGMPAFKGTLSDDQIHALANWLSAKK